MAALRGEGDDWGQRHSEPVTLHDLMIPGLIRLARLQCAYDRNVARTALSALDAGQADVAADILRAFLGDES